MLLIDAKERRYLIRLAPGARFESHAGIVEHNALIGLWEGSEVLTHFREGASGNERRFLVVRPTLSDVVLKMPRGAQVIYPKDLGAILVCADLFPGARVLEAGVGSGALSMVALRAGCVVIGYEIRPDFAARARANVAAELGEETPYEVIERDVYEGIEEVGLDRILLDLAEPWRVVEHAERALIPGGILCAYLPTINQTTELRRRLDLAGFGLTETIEVLQRSWHIEGRSVRPDHRMVAHTGFLTTTRRIEVPSARSRDRLDETEGRREES